MLLQRFSLFVVFFHYDSIADYVNWNLLPSVWMLMHSVHHIYFAMNFSPGFLFLFYNFYAFSHPSLSLQFIFPSNRELYSGAFIECSKLWAVSWTKGTCGEQHEAFSVAVYLYITCTVILVSKHVNPAWTVEYEVLPLDSQAILKVILESCNLCQEREKFGGNSKFELQFLLWWKFDLSGL